MKNFISIAVALSMIATPAIAGGREGNRGAGHEHREHRGGERHGSGCGWLCGAIIGGVVVGALSSRSQRVDNSTYEYAPPPQQYVCQNEYVRDYNGNYILDQYGRAIFRQRCWYQ